MSRGFSHRAKRLWRFVGTRSVLAELLALLVVTVVTGIAALRFDLSERLLALSQRYEAIQLDELITMAAVLALALLLFSGRRIVELRAEIRRREATESEMRRMAMHDGLTGLPNRRYFNEHLERALAGARRGDGVSVIAFDLDHFKDVNDFLGHAAGDSLLRAVAGRVRGLLRAGDLLARIGGDEFALVLRGSQPPQPAAVLAGRLAHALAQPFPILGHEVVVGASIGVAEFPLAGRSGSTLLCNADSALYRAKAEGRGGYCLFEPAVDRELQERRQLEQELRRAVSRQDLTVLYQPRHDPVTRELRGFEALVGWDHPERGKLDAPSFIPLAEACGLMAELTNFVLLQAGRAALAWPGMLRLAVNLSRAEFRDERIVDRIAVVLRQTGLSPDRLEIEVSEAVALSHIVTGRNALARLQAMGVHITMDDFGTGFASVTSLKKFPFERIKIDRVFVSGIQANGRERAIVEGIVGLGRALDLEVTAEGVESEAQLAALRQLGCVEVQGFLLGRPMDEAAAASLARTRLPPGHGRPAPIAAPPVPA